ncbi:MAG: VpaChn25_0724 family phage protein [Rhabdaerophilum sp.]
MSTMDRIIREDARLIILKALVEQPDGRLNSDLLRETLSTFGISKSRDWVHDELRHLAELGAVKVHEIGSVRVAELTAKGADHVARRILIEGIKRPSMPEA